MKLVSLTFFLLRILLSSFKCFKVNSTVFNQHTPTTFQMAQPPTDSNKKKTLNANVNSDANIKSKISSSVSLSSTDVSNATNINNDRAGVYYKSDINTSTNNHNITHRKKLLLIRHGTSLGNEFMERPGNRWGDKTFTDDLSLVDASLSQTGISQANMLRQKLKNRFVDPRVVNDGGDMENAKGDIIPVDDNLLVVTSPLQRCIETMIIGVLPNTLLTNSRNNSNYDGDGDEKKEEEYPQGVKIVVQPLATERIYTESDTGRPLSELQKDYPYLDFDTYFQTSMDQESWWYTHDKNSPTPYQEWRPFGDGQYYAVPGEPFDEFNQRMVDLFEWIDSREEQTIILVCHWGVIEWFTGEDVENCHVKEVIFDHLVLKDESWFKDQEEDGDYTWN